MNTSDYQLQAARTLIDAPDFAITDDQVMLVWNALGLVGEAGEFCDLIKKGIFHQHGLDRDRAIEELGDVLWYVATLCTRLGFTMDEVMQTNLDKLRERYPEGYSVADSMARVDMKEATP